MDSVAVVLIFAVGQYFDFCPLPKASSLDSNHADFAKTADDLQVASDIPLNKPGPSKYVKEKRAFH